MKLVYAVRLAVIIVGLFGSSCSQDSFASKRTVERAHGLKLPASARNFQLRQWGGFLDKGIVSLFQIGKQDVPIFTRQLTIKERKLPIKRGPGDPTVNGQNVWPDKISTFVPGNLSLAGLKRTWSGEAVPSEMLSCASPKGDGLHVEIWFTDTEAIIKLYTDWN
jgi:hypothetical protein